VASNIRIQKSGSVNEGEDAMMHDMSNGMMWGTNIVSLIGIAVLLLLAVALVKYIFFR
jgi:hypothetical protein